MSLPHNITLKFGDSGDSVKDMQARLVSLDFLGSQHANGFYDGNTVAAVRTFQGANGLRTDGVAGPKTLARLNAAGSTFTETKEAEQEKEGLDSFMSIDHEHQQLEEERARAQAEADAKAEAEAALLAEQQLQQDASNNSGSSGNNDSKQGKAEPAKNANPQALNQVDELAAAAGMAAASLTPKMDQNMSLEHEANQQQAAEQARNAPAPDAAPPAAEAAADKPSFGTKGTQTEKPLQDANLHQGAEQQAQQAEQAAANPANTAPTMESPPAPAAEQAPKEMRFDDPRLQAIHDRLPEPVRQEVQNVGQNMAKSGVQQSQVPAEMDIGGPQQTPARAPDQQIEAQIG